MPALLIETFAVAGVLLFLGAAALGATNPPLDAARLDIMHHTLTGTEHNTRVMSATEQRTRSPNPRPVWTRSHPPRQRHWPTALANGEQALLPAVRQADPDMVDVADGFSCQTQIADTVAGRTARAVGRRPNHASAVARPPRAMTEAVVRGQVGPAGGSALPCWHPRSPLPG